MNKKVAYFPLCGSRICVKIAVQANWNSRQGANGWVEEV